MTSIHSWQLIINNERTALVAGLSDMGFNKPCYQSPRDYHTRIL